MFRVEVKGKYADALLTEAIEADPSVTLIILQEHSSE